MAQPALIFIPDISGFTQFVTSTEIEHSNHIVKELLEVLLENNKLGLTVSEIEGDAILFYKIGSPPTLPEILAQVKRMFLSFHGYLQIIERDRVCQCGACQAAHKMTLKFISHYGEINEVSVQQFKNIMGKDVILAHRLLKSGIPESEYFVSTKSYFDALTEIDYDEQFVFSEHVEVYDNFGEVFTKYTSLNILRNEIPPPKPNKFELKTDRKPDKSFEIEAPLNLVHSLLIDQKRKIEWIKDLKAIKEDYSINRVNGSHTCIFDNFEIDFTTIANKESDGITYYSEQSKVFGDLYFITDYKLERLGEATNISIATYPALYEVRGNGKIKKNINRIKSFFVLFIIKRNSVKGFYDFKKFCENEYLKNKENL
ncbi:MAG: DUF2652 domain-containing protein [Melioribacteraceae bacterium]|nr:DUF2652 domain-containing protein [Melioribacteraceae bacterium]MCF8263459.1 DUF2652 domain-containing protein [Melioribacteraceae bacterium]MCF8414069.1 DUF2652 domain-containing protein [Melioribacteraceae bacterium]MCF8430996.1 DUF2652 domain-containing protein [Melioribacteraceae bacterium]